MESRQIILAGIGMGSGDVITEEVRRLIEEADCLIGAERMITSAQRIRNMNGLSMPGYINGNNNKQIWIDPTKWIGTDGKYPNGVVIGDIRYDLDGNVSNIHAEKGSALGYYPLYLWFDETYEGN